MPLPGSHGPAVGPVPAAPPLPSRAPSLLLAVVIAVSWAGAGAVVSVVGVLFVGLALNGYGSIGTLTTALWLGVAPGMTSLGGVPVAIGYGLGAKPLACVAIAALAVVLALGCWVLIFAVVPA